MSSDEGGSDFTSTERAAVCSIGSEPDIMAVIQVEVGQRGQHTVSETSGHSFPQRALILAAGAHSRSGRSFPQRALIPAAGAHSRSGRLFLQRAFIPTAGIHSYSGHSFPQRALIPAAGAHSRSLSQSSSLAFMLSRYLTAKDTFIRPSAQRD